MRRVLCSFIDEIVFTKEMQLTLDEVLYFMNINVDEKTSPTICPQDDYDDYDDEDDEDVEF